MAGRWVVECDASNPLTGRLIEWWELTQIPQPDLAAVLDGIELAQLQPGVWIPLAHVGADQQLVCAVFTKKRKPIVNPLGTDPGRTLQGR